MTTRCSPARMSEPCLKGCCSMLLEYDSDPAFTPQEHHAYTCARCQGTVCAMCGRTPVRWAGYICRRCTLPAPTPLTAKQLRTALESLADDEVVTFRKGVRTWFVAAPQGRDHTFSFISA